MAEKHSAEKQPLCIFFLIFVFSHTFQSVTFLYSLFIYSFFIFLTQKKV